MGAEMNQSTNKAADKNNPVAAALLPAFRYHGVVLAPEGLRYSPKPDIIHPSVIETDSQWDRPVAHFLMYYAPHDVPGGICLAVSDQPEGPWQEYDRNPLISADWIPHYRVSHVSSPHAVWNPEEQRLFLYFHGENDTTRFAVSRDGVHFEYGGVAVHTGLFEPEVSEASYARVFRHNRPHTKGSYVMLLMGNHNETRKIYVAWSRDGRRWTAEKTALIVPPPGTNQMGPGWLFAWGSRLFILCFANREDSPVFDPISDLYLYEVDPDLNQVAFCGLFMHHAAAGLGNARLSDPCLIQTANRLFLFLNVGRRLQQRIALAVADID